jgi:hypothetical protein
MCAVNSMHKGLILVDGVSTFIVVKVAILDQVYFVLIHEVFQLPSELAGARSVFIGGVKGPMRTYHYPFDVWIVSGVFEVVFKEVVLLRSKTIGMF